jgi:hypothetical protein
VVRGWGNIARDAAQTAGFWLLMGLITYLGMSVVVKIEATWTRLLLVVVVFGAAFCAASLVAYLLRDRMPKDTHPNGQRTEIWPEWFSRSSEPTVYRRSDHMQYSYVVLPRPNCARQASTRAAPAKA